MVRPLFPLVALIVFSVILVVDAADSKAKSPPPPPSHAALSPPPPPSPPLRSAAPPPPPKTTTQSPPASKAPKLPKAPPPPKAPKPPKAPPPPKAPKPPKAPSPPKAPKLPKTPSPPKAPKLPKTPSPPKAPKPPKVPPPPKPVKPKKEKCKDKNYRYCYNTAIECPRNCPRNCYIHCLTCKPICMCNVPGAVCQDPRFIGADGITFYFHGRKDREFCLLSDSNLHINAHFIGRRAPNMTRDFTWVQSVGILFGSHRIYIGAQKTATWDDNVDRLTVIFDGETLTLPPEEGATWPMDPASAVSVSRTADANAITLEVEGSFKISAKVVPITDEDSRVHGYAVAADDCLAHLELGFKFYSLTAEVHGVLGQTYREDYVSRVKMSSNMPIMGGEPKYLSSGIYSIDCSVARFGRENPAAAIFAATEQASLSCDSGMGGGRGIVCKK